MFGRLWAPSFFFRGVGEAGVWTRSAHTLDDSRNNKVNIEFLKEQMDKALENIEKLKDADREIVYKNGNGDH